MEKCICREFDKTGEINGFKTTFDFIKFEKELHSDVLAGELVEIGFHMNQYWERLFKCSKCGTVWVLTEPEFPFEGHWKKQ